MIYLCFGWDQVVSCKPTAKHPVCARPPFARHWVFSSEQGWSHSRSSLHTNTRSVKCGTGKTHGGCDTCGHHSSTLDTRSESPVVLCQLCVWVNRQSGQEVSMCLLSVCACVGGRVCQHRHTSVVSAVHHFSPGPQRCVPSCEGSLQGGQGRRAGPRLHLNFYPGLQVRPWPHCHRPSLHTAPRALTAAARTTSPLLRVWARPAALVSAPALASMRPCDPVLVSHVMRPHDPIQVTPTRPRVPAPLCSCRLLPL